MQRWSVHTVINGDTAGNIAGNDGVAFQFQQGDGSAFLASYPFTSRELVYCDPCNAQLFRPTASSCRSTP